MSTTAISAIQFVPRPQPSIDTPQSQMPDVMPLGANTATSASRTTAWRLRRDRFTPPQPYSRETAGSTYRFGDQ